MKTKTEKILKIFKNRVAISAVVFLLVVPASTDYKLKDFGFGSGGGSASSSSYSTNLIIGEISNGNASSANFKTFSGLIFMEQANVPEAPMFSNPSNYYNKLQIILNTSNNPIDTKYAIAISTDNFASITKYIKNDNTIGTSLELEDYQTYAAWGGASGFLVVGLTSNTTYQIKVKALQGKFSETGYGPIATAATINPTLSFAIRTDSQVSSPFSITFGDMTTNAVNTSTEKIWADFSTNGENGGRVYVSGANAGLYSSTAGHKINAMSADLSGQTEGFGAQGYSVTQTSGGPLTIVNIYSNVGTDTVGIVDNNIRDIFNSAGPIVGGRGIFLLKAKPSSVAPSAIDYTEILTLIASASF